MLHKAPINVRAQMKARSIHSESSLHVIKLCNPLTKGKQEKRLLVYFEGIAGCGKTTLAWYISREWAEKRIVSMKNHQLLIHVQMNDPKVQSAMYLKDLIPNPDDDKVLQKVIAEEIVGTKGRNVCFLLDGLDEAPTRLLDLLLVELIQEKLGRQPLPNLSFILMSRPDSCVTK